MSFKRGSGSIENEAQIRTPDRSPQTKLLQSSKIPAPAGPPRGTSSQLRTLSSFVKFENYLWG